MKKILLIIVAILLIGIAFYIVTNKRTRYNKYNSYNNKSEYYQNKGNQSNDNSKNNNYTEVDGVPFNKGYNNDYDKAAVEKANQEHSTVTLNSKFTVKGQESVQGATDCTYVRDIDGDTLVASANGKNYPIRFYGIDSSEEVNPKIHCVEPYSIQAKNFVESKLKVGDTIKILFNKSKGKYGRDVGTIYYEQNNLWYNLNEEEVANGLARIAYLNQNNSNINVKELYDAEDSAKSQNLNIWSIPGYVTPYGYNLAIFH